MAVTINGKKPNPYDGHLSGTPAKVTVKQAKGHVGVAVAKHVDGASGIDTATYDTVSDEPELLHKGIMMAAPEACEVTVVGGATLNLGDMEFAKISVSVMVPCAKDDLNETYEFATNWVSDKLNTAIQKIKDQ